MPSGLTICSSSANSSRLVGEVLDDALDHEVAVGEVGRGGRWPVIRASDGVALGRLELALGDLACRGCSVTPATTASAPALVRDRTITSNPASGGHLGQARSHDPRPDDAHRVDLTHRGGVVVTQRVTTQATSADRIVAAPGLPTIGRHGWHDRPRRRRTRSPPTTTSTAACSPPPAPTASSCCRPPTPSRSRRRSSRAAMPWGERLGVDGRGADGAAAPRRRGRGRGRRRPRRARGVAGRRLVDAPAQHAEGHAGARRAIGAVLAAGGVVAAVGSERRRAVRPDARPARRGVHARPRPGARRRRHPRRRGRGARSAGTARCRSPTRRSSSCRPGRRCCATTAGWELVGDAGRPRRRCREASRERQLSVISTVSTTTVSLQRVVRGRRGRGR